MRGDTIETRDDATSTFSEAANWLLIAMGGALTLAVFLVRF